MKRERPVQSEESRRILIVHHGDAAVYPPLQRIASILAGRSWRVSLIGFRDEARVLDLPDGIEQHRVRRWKNPWMRHLAVIAAVWRALLRLRPQWIYVSDPLACTAAITCSWFPGLHLAYHEHDIPFAPKTIRERLVSICRKAIARRAELVVVPSAGRVEALPQTVRVPVISNNCPSLDEVHSIESDKQADGLTVFFHGSIVPERLPMTVLQALASLPPDVRLRVAGYETLGSLGYIQALNDEAQRLQLGERFEYIGEIFARGELLARAAGSHLGLAIVPMRTHDPNMTSMAGASNKPFEFLACGLALLVSDLPDWTTMFVSPGYARACDPSQATTIMEALQWFHEHPEERLAMATRGRSRVLAEWNYEKQFQAAVSRLERSDR